MLYVSVFHLRLVRRKEWDPGERRKLIKLKVHIGTSIEKCREINKRLLDDEGVDGGYEDAVFENLVYRYEEPNGMTRWDSPLFTVPYDDAHPPYEQIWEAIMGSEGTGKVVKPNMATMQVRVDPISKRGEMLITVGRGRNQRRSRIIFTSLTR